MPGENGGHIPQTTDHDSRRQFGVSTRGLILFEAGARGDYTRLDHHVNGSGHNSIDGKRFRLEQRPKVKKWSQDARFAPSISGGIDSTPSSVRSRGQCITGASDVI